MWKLCSFLILLLMVLLLYWFINNNNFVNVIWHILIFTIMLAAMSVDKNNSLNGI